MGIDLHAETAAEGTTPVRLDVVRGDFTQPAVDLLPLGPLLWRRNDDSQMWEAQEAWGYQHYRADRRADVFERERMPNKAADMLPEWEEQMAVPGACDVLGTDFAERRETLAAKWRAHTLTGGEAFADIGEALGYDIRLQSAYKPFRANEGAVGDAIQDWPYWWGIRTTEGARDDELHCRYDEISRLWAAYFFDFHDWTDWVETGGAADPLHSVATNGLSWVLVGPSGGGGVIGTGDFGANYSNISGGVPAGIDWQSIAYGTDRYVACGDDRVMVAQPPDLSSGGSWVPQTFGTVWRGVTYGEEHTSHGNRFMLVGDAGDLRTSIDRGATWVVRTTGSIEDLYDSAFHDGVWIVVGENGEILRSVDGGETWVPQSSGVVVDLHCVTWGNGLWVAAGNSGKIVTSPDGRVWTVQTIASALAMWDVAFSTVGGFCIVGHSAKFYTSTTGLGFVENTAPGSPDILRGVTTDDEGRWWASGLSGKMIKLDTDDWWRLTNP